ncbi:MULTISPECIES: hypothetical protein [unclassified Gordonia (in: high G+C Gram-positive bacteria)]|uniref:hypothetical protein n=1 Tax=unclassified Gordonia (in: high G+C Gram-positive bacteria) TaxID=2657482 RepID=UPI001964BBBE|nr:MULTISPECIES: hypothetical protein [unclassified Gordonia (in: high G+C Gram-positive bacteria)]MBN0975106.1 hypothetical protein [Gordonia sp. BP-119]MBN0985279.1 hypothetical protein [Gordonia sp. BP-94]
MVPSTNAWISRDVGPDRAVEVVAAWLADAGDNYGQRGFVLSQKRDLRDPPPAVARFIANGNVGSGRNLSITTGGPILAFAPSVELLAAAVGLADGNALGVVEHGAGEVAGWAAAVSAIDLGTGMARPEVDAVLREAFESIYDAGYNGYSVSDSFLRRRIDDDLALLAEEGISFTFLAGYMVGLGAGGHRLAGLRQLYAKHAGR